MSKMKLENSARVLESLRERKYEEFSSQERILLFSLPTNHEILALPTKHKVQWVFWAIGLVLAFGLGYPSQDLMGDALFYLIIYVYASAYFTECKARLEAEFLLKSFQHQERMRDYLNQSDS